MFGFAQRSARVTRLASLRRRVACAESQLPSKRANGVRFRRSPAGRRAGCSVVGRGRCLFILRSSDAQSRCLLRA
eukprot:13895809-Alexandrium_andersonii.AAC.1